MDGLARNNSAARCERCGMLEICFGGTSVGKDGMNTAAEFDGMCEEVSCCTLFRFGRKLEKPYSAVGRSAASGNAVFDKRGRRYRLCEFREFRGRIARRDDVDVLRRLRPSTRSRSRCSAQLRSAQLSSAQLSSAQFSSAQLRLAEVS